MNRQAETAPLQTGFVLSTQFPCPPRRSSLPPRPPKVPTTRRQQIESQNFNPGPRLFDQSPVFGSLTPMSPALFRGFQSAPVAYHNAGGRPPLPFTTSVSSLSLGEAHGRGYSYNNSAGLHSIEMPVGVNYSKDEGPGEPASFMDEYVTSYMELDKIFDFSDDVERISNGSSEDNRRNPTYNLGVKKPSRRTRRRKSVLHCNNNLNINGIEPGLFTPSQMNEIACSEKLIKQAVTNPKSVKRILKNRETARRTHERTEQHILALEKKIQTLEKEAATLTAHIRSVRITKLGLEEENKQIRIRLQEMEEQSKHANALTECYNGELNLLKQKGRREVIPIMETTVDDYMLELLNHLDEEMEYK
ncbi:hypothetical protein Bca101_009578 [Brassica carinata]